MAHRGCLRAMRIDGSDEQHRKNDIRNRRQLLAKKTRGEMLGEQLAKLALDALTQRLLAAIRIPCEALLS